MLPKSCSNLVVKTEEYPLLWPAFVAVTPVARDPRLTSLIPVRQVTVKRTPLSAELTTGEAAKQEVMFSLDHNVERA